MKEPMLRFYDPLKPIKIQYIQMQHKVEWELFFKNTAIGEQLHVYQTFSTNVRTLKTD